ncbi:HpyAIV family type II restriction enzyme [Mycoplasmopsis lipofaciens]|uniref:HpyAIV family type II restriction enzyme n=1 Tax=Mycoplasmopsis lipofaciens TaxID=114884 RepID=UPI0004852D1E|nr:hypothetical protein [Mycoplasmopsis lipofaciens]
MDYNQFEIQLKKTLTTNNGPKLLMKLIDAPYRYISLLNPFNFKTKMEQSFLRTQENTYYKFLKEIAEYFLIQYQYELLDNNIQIHRPINENEFETVKLKPQLLFTDQEKNLNVVWIKKRDTYSASKAVEIFEKFVQNIKDIQFGYKEYKIKGFIWFIDNEFHLNENYYLSQIDSNLDQLNLKIVYSSDFLAHFDHKSDWEQIEQHMYSFKQKDYNFLLEMPNLDTDSETLEFMINMSNSSWEKLISNDDIYLNIRNKIFDQRNENSNFFKALKIRNIKETALDEDDFKLKRMQFENNK